MKNKDQVKVKTKRGCPTKKKGQIKENTMKED